MALARRARLLGDHLDQPRDEGQAFLVVRRSVRIARLAEPAHVADHRDRPDRVVVALEAPGGDRRVVDCGVHREIELDVPLEPIEDRARAFDPEVRRELVRDHVGEDVPVPGRGLRLRPVRPELRHDPVEVTLVDDVRRVWLARRRVDRVAVAVIRAERVAAARAGRDVDRRLDRGIEEARVADDLDGLILVGLVGRRVPELGRGAGIDGRPRSAPVREGKALDVAPLRPDRLLDPVRDRDAVLADHVLELERLPAVRIDEAGVAGVLDDERRVDRLVVGRRVAVGLVRAVGLAVGEDGRRDPVADRRRAVAVSRRGRDRVAQAVHQVVELVEGLARPDRLDVAGRQDPVGGVADRLVPGGSHVGRRVLLGEDVARCRRVVGRPGVPHRDRRVEQVAGVDGRVRKGSPDRVEEGLVPASGDGPVGMGGDRRRRRARGRRGGQPADDEATKPDDGGHAQRERGQPRRSTPRHVCPPQPRRPTPGRQGTGPTRSWPPDPILARAARSNATSVAMLPRLNARSTRGADPSRIAPCRSSTSAR